MSLGVFQTAPWNELNHLCTRFHDCWTASLLPRNSGTLPPPTPSLSNRPSLLSHCPPPPSAHCPAAASPPQQQSGICLAMLLSSFCSSSAQQLLLLLLLLLPILLTVGLRPSCSAAAASWLCSPASAHTAPTPRHSSCPFPSPLFWAVQC
eukprot:148124-Pelagomonas_calceolata.AAC.3